MGVLALGELEKETEDIEQKRAMATEEAWRMQKKSRHVECPELRELQENPAS